MPRRHLAAAAATAAAAALALAAGVDAAGAKEPPATPTPTQALVMLLASHTAMSAPTRRSWVIEQVPARRPITGTATVLPVIGQRSGREGDWLQVRLPGRPNGHVGWIHDRATRKAQTAWAIQVTLATRRVTVYHRGRLARTFPVVIGKPSTPTPRGVFFVEEAVRLPTGQAGAPYALALSSRSDALRTFEGGPGQIALHGTAHLDGRPGQALSHGCLRLASEQITWLVAHVDLGTPVVVR